MFVEFNVLFLLRKYFITIFSEDLGVIDITNQIIWIVLIVIVQDLLQWTLAGTIKALAKQNAAAIINFVTYDVLVIPLSLLFVLKFEWGLEGIWYAFIIGMCN